LLTKELSVMNGIEKRFVLDTNAVIFLTDKGNVIPAGLENELNDADLFISVINEIELFSKPSLPLDKEELLRNFLSDRTVIIDLTDDIKQTTITLRRSAKLKLPDCIVAATSIVLDAVLFTNDKDLLNLSHPGFQVQNIQ